MKTATWPYGTQKAVTVVQRSVMAGGIMLMCVHDDLEAGQTEMYACVFNHQHEAAMDARVEDKGTITFTQGGPTGGFWDYAPSVT